MSALLFAREGTTLLFVPQQQHAESTARSLLAALSIQRALAAQAGEEFSLPTQGRGGAAWDRCRSIIRSEMGDDALLLELLDEGIVVHHGDLPGRVRVAVEDLARTEAVRLIVATTTLAQGVNLPIKTVLVRGLHIDQSRTVSPMTFWNICGRAGRGMKENEGQVLFCVDRTKTRGQLWSLDRTIREVLDTLEQANVVSGMLQVLQRIAEEWRKAHPETDLSELCLYLAENKFDWVSEQERVALRAVVDTLDGHLLALSEEFALEPTSPDRLQELLHGSLLFIQLRDQTGGLTPETARDILHSRIRHVHRTYPDQRVRKRLYLLGMTLSGCERIESEKDKLLALFAEAESWATWGHEQRTDLLVRISDFIFSVRDTAPKYPVPSEWPAILSAWLAGMSTTEMARLDSISTFSRSPSELSLLVEDYCGYRMPWGLNSIVVHLKALEDETGMAIPGVCSYFAGMVKYGVSDPVAVCVVPYLDHDRPLAIRTAAVCPHDSRHPDDIIRWILSVRPEDLVEAGLDQGDADAVVRLRSRRGREAAGEAARPADEIRFLAADEACNELAIGDKVLVAPDPSRGPGGFEILTLEGARLGEYRHTGKVPGWWSDLHLVDSEVMSIGAGPAGHSTITVNLVAT